MPLALLALALFEGITMNLYQFKGQTLNLQELRAALRKLPDAELLKFSEALGRRKQQGDLELRNEASAEWKRRYPLK